MMPDDLCTIFRFIVPLKLSNSNCQKPRKYKQTNFKIYLKFIHRYMVVPRAKPQMVTEKKEKKKFDNTIKLR